MALIPSISNLYHVVWSGTLNPSEEEIFAYGRYAYTEAAVLPPAIGDELENDVTNMLAESTTGSTPFSNLGQIFPTHVHWTQLKVSQIDKTTGALMGEPDVRPLTDEGLGATSQGLPYQDTLAITYEAAAPDRKRRNRFYLPPMVSTATDGHGRILGTLIDDIHTQIALDANAHDVSDVHLSWCIRAAGSSTGGWEIDRYHTGDVMDTQRRRRNKLPEVRHTHAPL